MFTMVRHVESTANAGLPSNNPAEIQLSEKGLRQAELFAKLYNDEPSSIVHSQYYRTKQTALPLMRKLPHVPVHVSSLIHEFTYLDTTKYVGTTVQERRSAAVAYWEMMDDRYTDGNAESFTAFMARVAWTLGAYQDTNALLFTHEMFIQLAILLWTGEKIQNVMETFYKERHTIHVPNGSMHTFTVNNGRGVVETKLLPLV